MINTSRWSWVVGYPGSIAKVRLEVTSGGYAEWERLTWCPPSAEMGFVEVSLNGVKVATSIL